MFELLIVKSQSFGATTLIFPFLFYLVLYVTGWSDSLVGFDGVARWC